MFFRVRRPRQELPRDPPQDIRPAEKKKRRKPNKNLLAALDPDVMKDEYFVTPTQEEAEEITRILEAKNHFEVLELDHKDDLDEKEDELRQSYLRKVLLLNSHISNHPRMTEAFEKLSQAYDVLSDPILRLEHKYDKFGGRPQTADNLGMLLQSMFDDDDMRMPMLLPPTPMMGRAPVMMRRGNQDPMMTLLNGFFGGMQSPRQVAPPLTRTVPPPQPVRRLSNESEESEIDEFMNDFARLMFGPMPTVSPAERRRREREEQRRLRMENMRRREAEQAARQEQERQQLARGEVQAGEGLPGLMQLLLGAPVQRTTRPQQRSQRQVTVIGPGNVRFVHTNEDGSQPPVVRARPWEETRENQPQRVQLRRQETGRELEEKLQTLMGMGFSEEDSLRALDLANGNVEHAVTLLLG